MMIDNGPIRPVEPSFKSQIRHPRGFFAEFPLFPDIVVIGFEADICAEHLSRKPLQQYTGDQTVEIAFVCEDYIRLREQICHRVELRRPRMRWPAGILNVQY